MHGTTGALKNHDDKPIMKYTALLIFLLLVAISGCSVLQNSETYYLEHPRGGPIHWREYED